MAEGTFYEEAEVVAYLRKGPDGDLRLASKTFIWERDRRNVRFLAKRVGDNAGLCFLSVSPAKSRALTPARAHFESEARRCGVVVSSKRWQKIQVGLPVSEMTMRNYRDVLCNDLKVRPYFEVSVMTVELGNFSMCHSA